MIPKNDYKLIQYLIKKKYPNFLFSSSTQWCENRICLLCGQYQYYKAIEHFYSHLKECKLFNFT